MKKLLIANWKMNPITEKEAVKLAHAEDFRNTVIIPPFPFLRAVKRTVKNALLGAQDVFYEEKGAYTGEISSAMLRSLGVKYVIVGHSERRALGETDADTEKKVRAAADSRLRVILCVGEPLPVRKKGNAEVKKYIRTQLRMFKDLKIKNLIIAYEPVWAIGTGRNASPEDAAEIARFIKSVTPVPVLYGGSTNAKNAPAFLEKKEIAGLLVGGASLDAREFGRMAKIAGRA